MTYKYQSDFNGGHSESVILRVDDDGVINFIPNDSLNKDWQEYQAWLAADPENNIPEPADEE